VLDGRYAWVEEGILDPSGEGPMIGSQPEAAREAAEREPSADDAALSAAHHE